MNHTIFNNRKALLVTMHGKEVVLGNYLKETFNITLDVTRNINTDQFGSFSGEIERKVIPQYAAKQKISAALKNYEHEIIIASEGSFFQHPANPFIQVNNEFILLMDRKNEIAIEAQWTSSNVKYFKKSFSNDVQAYDFCIKNGFPNYGVLLKANTLAINPLIIKDSNTESDLKKAICILINESISGEIEVESDMRAHRNPTRMKNISIAAQQLVNNMQRQCPECLALGYSIKSSIPGLECAHCTFPSNETKGYLYHCKSCAHQEIKPIQTEQKADPTYCPKCNP